MMGTVLVLGATGNFGVNAAREFEAAGWQVRRWKRGTDMAAAAKGADVIVNGLNPPNYHAWDRLIPEITAEVLAAARASGATVLVPGNVYVYGDQPGPWGPETPHRPVARKGRIRAEMEAAYRAASAEGVRAIFLHGGDFVDPDSEKSFFNMLVLKKVPKGKITAFGAADVRRAYAYLPDMARAAVALAGMRAELPAFADITFPGHAFSIADLRRLVEAETGRTMRITRFPWWLMRLASPFWELAREMMEMRYLYETPHELSGEAFGQLLPGFRHTPLAEIIAAHPPIRAAKGRQGRSISTQTRRWREAASTASAPASPGSGHQTPAPVTARPAAGRT